MYPTLIHPSTGISKPKTSKKTDENLDFFTVWKEKFLGRKDEKTFCYVSRGCSVEHMGVLSEVRGENR